MTGFTFYQWWLYSWFLSAFCHDVVRSFNPSMQRRPFLIQSSLVLSTGTIPQSASSLQETPRIKPYAPLDQLLPAVRVKQRIDRALVLAVALRDSKSTITQSSFADLQSLLFPPPNALLGTTTTTTTTTIPSYKSNSNNKPGQIYMKSYQRTRELVPLLARPGAWLVQTGEINAWKNLQSREQNQENRDEVRAAFNTYTNALTFNAESYLWTASPDLKKQLIRQDRLPDVTAVVTADLDLRYLYRNQILTALEDARAEWLYQTVPQQEEEKQPDVTELVDILKQAQNACNQWFDFIDERDVQEAMKVVNMEWNTR